MQNYLPFRPKKGQAFDLYFDMRDPYDFSYRSSGFGATDFLKTFISKDGNAFVEKLGIETQIDFSVSNNARGVLKVALTADDMDADVIIIKCQSFRVDGTTEDSDINTIIIYTDGSNDSFGENSGGSSNNVSSNQVSAVISALVVKGYTISKTATDVNGYNYYGLASNTIWYVIIKEKTDYSTIGYYMSNDRRVAFSTAWSGKESLVYRDRLRIFNR